MPPDDLLAIAAAEKPYDQLYDEETTGATVFPKSNKFLNFNTGIY